MQKYLLVKYCKSFNGINFPGEEKPYCGFMLENTIIDFPHYVQAKKGFAAFFST
jgi:hypothetical protein